MSEVATIQMPQQKSEKGYHEILKDDQSLETFLVAVREFNEFFCKHMFEGQDFTIRLEARGNQGVLLHARVYSDKVARPKGAEKRLDIKRQENHN